MTFAGVIGVLKLENSASFSGTVAGMIGGDTIDFAVIDPTKVQPPTYSGDSSSGTLTMTTFVASSDCRGDTAVIDPAVLGGIRPLVTPPHA